MKYKIIQECKQKVLSGEVLSLKETKDLFNVSDKSLKILAQAANEVTRKFNGLKVDIEELNNIKKMDAVKIVYFVRNLHSMIHKLKNINFHQSLKLYMVHKKQKKMVQLLIV